MSELPYIKKNRKEIMLLFDILAGVTAFYLAFYLRFDGLIPDNFFIVFKKYWLIYVISKIGASIVLGVYKRMWKYAGIVDLLVVVNAVTVAILFSISLSYYLQDIVPRSVYILTWVFDIVLSSGIKIAPKILNDKRIRINTSKYSKGILIVGAGDAGVLVVKELLRREDAELIPIGFIDDDKNKENLRIMGLPVLGAREQLAQVINDYGVQEVLIAMPSAPGTIIKEIVNKCREAKVNVRTLPRMYDIINGEISVDLIREVKVEDLLGRETVRLDLSQIEDTIKNRVVLVTGAGGSIGSELCRQICRFAPKEIHLLGHDENPIFEIEMELKTKLPHVNIYSVIADIKDKNRINRVFAEIKPEIVFHAAAHKHVPLMESNPGESFKNNVIGTKNVAEASDKYSVDTFVLISTDKAVNPSSVMGVTKRIAEIIIQNLNEYSSTNFVAVRFGNVLGSRGSVIPIFQEQIRRGGPVTVTHPDMCRYFMTIPEAVQLVLQAASMAKGGEIFILDMGEPVKIVDLAKELIRLSGLEPGKDIDIEYTGVRSGEKLFEELLTAQEGTSATKHKRIYIAKKQRINDIILEKLYFDISQNKYYLKREEIFDLLYKLENVKLEREEQSVS